MIKHSRLVERKLLKNFVSVLFVHRFLLGTIGFLCGTGIKPTDIMYNTLPLYHSLGKFFSSSTNRKEFICSVQVVGFVSPTGMYKSISNG